VLAVSRGAERARQPSHQLWEGTRESEGMDDFTGQCLGQSRSQAELAAMSEAFYLQSFTPTVLHAIFTEGGGIQLCSNRSK